ncbi:alkylhydroperoxidase, partial [Rhizobium ruizarguesonis]
LQAIFNFSARLSTTPPEAAAADAQALADVGLDELEALDLVLSSAIFGWANRLMHTLGEPVKD